MYLRFLINKTILYLNLSHGTWKFLNQNQDLCSPQSSFPYIVEGILLSHFIFFFLSFFLLPFSLTQIPNYEFIEKVRKRQRTSFFFFFIRCNDWFMFWEVFFRVFKFIGWFNSIWFELAIFTLFCGGMFKCYQRLYYNGFSQFSVILVLDLEVRPFGEFKCALFGWYFNF